MKLMWTEFAMSNLKDIFDYHKEAASYRVASKIRKDIFSSTKKLLKNPQSGQTELFLEKLKENHRYVVSGHYKVIYKVSEDFIFITDIFDTRQNPIKINNPKRKNN